MVRFRVIYSLSFVIIIIIIVCPSVRLLVYSKKKKRINEFNRFDISSDVLQGYQGMVDGSIELAEWKTVSSIIQKVCHLYIIYYLLKISVLFPSIVHF